MSDDKEPLSVYTLLAATVDQFAGVAWQKLGLQPDPFTGAVEKDLHEAKVAIDICADLSAHLEPTLDEDDRREVHILLRNLRLNYVEKAKEG